ncbi:MAG TPA: DinB family protein [Thermomicrobiales bacterium]|nr:DinB family protein [Thermomicrobiales bacterium]
MSPRSDRLVTEFTAVNDDLISCVSECSDEQWQRQSVEEGWTVAAVAHHVAVSNGAIAGMLSSQVAGNPDLPNISTADLNANNAAHARDYATVGKQETLDLLRSNGDAVVQTLQSIDDDTFFDRPAGIFGGNELSVGQVAQFVLVGHTAGHTASIKASLAD